MFPPAQAGTSAPRGARYLRLSASGEAVIKERGSKFLAFVQPVDGEESALARLRELQAVHSDATHLCFAWRLAGTRLERSFDAGEPSGTAGVPMLRVLQGSGLGDVLAVVVRWFGGIKLGKGGLARAYAEAVRQALDGIAREEHFPSREMRLDGLSYEQAAVVKRLLRAPHSKLTAAEYGKHVTLCLRIADDERQRFREQLAEAAILFPE